MKKILFALFIIAVIVSSTVISASAVSPRNTDSSADSLFPAETNVSESTDTSILDSMMPGSMGTNVPDSAVESNSVPDSTAAITDDSDDGTSALIGVIIAIIAVIAVIVLIIVFIPKNRDKK